MLTIDQILLRLAVAAFLGAAIGVEREIRRQPAGIRTSMFVSLGSALFTILSVMIAVRSGDSSGTRIASNIVQGIGFLGAGAILRESGGIVGMTTAATIWVEAAIGMAAGGGLYNVAGYSTGIVLFSLVAFAWFEQRFNLKPRMMTFRIVTDHSDAIAGEVQRLLSQLKISAGNFRVSMDGANSIVEFGADVTHAKQEIIMARLHRTGVSIEAVPASTRE